MPKISKKSEDKLYAIVHEEIMKARIKIAQSLKGVVHHTISNEVDDILSSLTIKCPKAAIDMFR